MTNGSCRARFPVLGRVVVSCLAFCCFAYGQINYYPNQEVRISDLPALTSPSKDASDVLETSVEIVFRDKEVCCGKNSVLQDSVQSADPTSLKDVGNKLQGKRVTTDGRSIMVTAEYLPASAPPEQLISALMEKRPALMEWDSHLYIVYGAIFDETLDSSTRARTDTIRQLLLIDTRFSGTRRQVSFHGQTDDWGKVQDLLMLKAATE
jgi:hypothetical protein